MSWTKLLGLVIVVSSYGCKSTEAAGAKAAEEIKSTVGSVTGDVASTQKMPLKTTSAVLLQWKYGRLSLQMKNNEAIEVRDKPGRVVCEITEDGVRGVFGEARLGEVKSALTVLASVRGNTKRNPMFRAYEESRELVGYSNGEFVIEAMYQAQEVLTPSAALKAADFEAAYNTVISVARDTKLCPKLD